MLRRISIIVCIATLWPLPSTASEVRIRVSTAVRVKSFTYQGRHWLVGQVMGVHGDSLVLRISVGGVQVTMPFSNVKEMQVRKADKGGWLSIKAADEGNEGIRMFLDSASLTSSKRADQGDTLPAGLWAKATMIPEVATSQSDSSRQVLTGRIVRFDSDTLLMEMDNHIPQLVPTRAISEIRYVQTVKTSRSDIIATSMAIGALVVGGLFYDGNADYSQPLGATTPVVGALVGAGLGLVVGAIVPAWERRRSSFCHSRWVSHFSREGVWLRVYHLTSKECPQ